MIQLRRKQNALIQLFELLKQRLKEVGELASGSVQNAFSDLLDKVNGWLERHRDDIIWFSDKAAEISGMIVDKSKNFYQV